MLASLPRDDVEDDDDRKQFFGDLNIGKGMPASVTCILFDIESIKCVNCTAPDKNFWSSLVINFVKMSQSRTQLGNMPYISIWKWFTNICMEEFMKDKVPAF